MMLRTVRLSLLYKIVPTRTAQCTCSVFRFSSSYDVANDDPFESLRDYGDRTKEKSQGYEQRDHWVRDNRLQQGVNRKLRFHEDWDTEQYSDKNWGNRFTNLKKVNWNLDTDPVQKTFYKEHPAIENRSKEADVEYFEQHNITTEGSDILRPILSFDEINFPEPIKRTIKAEEWSEPTPTQAMGWPLGLSGRDIIGISRTGSGKTAAFLLPGLVHIMNQKRVAPDDGPIFLCLVPTRELAQQVGHVAERFARPLYKRTAIVYGGAMKGGQLRQLQRAPEIMIATPGRLMDFLEMEETNMGRCTFLVIDEADRMLDMGFEPQIRKIINQIRPDRQTMMYTATWPKEVQALAREFQNDPVRVNIGSTKLHANSNIQQRIEICGADEKTNKLTECLKAISQEEQNKTLIFVSTKAKANWLERKLQRVGWSANAIHGDKSQNQRDRILNEFRSSRVPVLIATDVASRGLDVKDIAYVINMDFPLVIEDYVHRIGRTARAEKSGIAISFFSDEDFKLSRDLVNILRDSKQHVPEQLEIIARHTSGSSKRPRQTSGSNKRPYKQSQKNFSGGSNWRRSDFF